MFVVQLKETGSWRSCIWLMTWFRTVRKRVLSSPKTSKASWWMPAHTWPGKLPFTCASHVHRQGFVLSHVCCVCFSGRDGDDGGKKHMERLLNIWQERSLYRPDFIQQLKLAIEDSDSPKHKPTGQSNTSTLLHSIYCVLPNIWLVVCLVCHATHNTLKYVYVLITLCKCPLSPRFVYWFLSTKKWKQQQIIGISNIQNVHSAFNHGYLCKDVYVLTSGSLVK